MLLDADLSVLVLIDLQQRLLPAIDGGDAVVAQCVRLARIATLFGVPVLGTEQTPEKLGGNDPILKTLCDRTVEKQYFDACGDGLIEVLPAARRSIVIGGCEAHVCVLQTALGLLERDYEVSIVAEAVGSRRSADRDAALARLLEAGAEIVTVEMVAFEWMGHSGHPRFRDVLKLIK